MRNNHCNPHNQFFFQTRRASLWFGTIICFLISLTCLSGTYQSLEYLTKSEVMKLRKAQKPYRRIATLNAIFKSRMKSAVASKKRELDFKTKSKVSSREETVDRETKDKDKFQGKSFVRWMQEVILCLEEIETNLENFSIDQALNSWDVETGLPIHMDHKKYGNALKKLLNSLNKMNEWLIEIHDQLLRSEKKLSRETSEFLIDLTVYVHKIIKMTVEEPGLKTSGN